MKTVYMYRLTDDTHEDHAVVGQENHVYLEGMTGLAEAICDTTRRTGRTLFAKLMTV
jgi:hypothetical protein